MLYDLRAFYLFRFVSHDLLYNNRLYKINKTVIKRNIYTCIIFYRYSKFTDGNTYVKAIFSMYCGNKCGGGGHLADHIKKVLEGGGNQMQH